MSKYQLSYDVVDSEKNDNDEVLNELTKKLVVNGAKNITRPVASTLVFETEDNDFRKIKTVVSNFSSQIYYVFSLVAQTKDKKSLIECKGNQELEDNYVEKYLS